MTLFGEILVFSFVVFTLGVVAYALVGRMTVDLTTEPLGLGKNGAPVYLRDIWPTDREIQETMVRAVHAHYRHRSGLWSHLP